jgi:anti-sigma B factor antagonist
MTPAPYDKLVPASQPPAHRLSLQITAQSDNTTTVACIGKLTAGLTELLRSEVKPLIPKNHRIVLDLTELTQMDSMGLGTIVSLYVSAKASGCDLQLINFSKRVRELLGMTNLLSVFESYGEGRPRLP